MRRTRAFVFVALTLILTLSMGAATVSAHPRRADVYPPNATPHGLVNLAELWSDWAFQPEPTNPIFHPRCESSGVGNIWLAPGAHEAGAELDCRLPVGAKLLISPGGVECSTTEGLGETLEELTACAETNVGVICCVEASVDGAPVRRIDRYLLTTGGQVLAGPNLFGPDPTLSVSRGWYILLRPMQVGHHEVFIHGAAPDFGVEFEITFDIKVVPRRH